VTRTRLWAPLLLCSCGAGLESATLSWRLGDGRTCAGGGVASVRVANAPTCQASQLPAERSPPRAHFLCSAGEAPAKVSASELPADSELYLCADSLEGAVLYVGTFALAAPAPIDAQLVTLYSAGAP
jgi:hypothetical protein